MNWDNVKKGDEVAIRHATVTRTGKSVPPRWEYVKVNRVGKTWFEAGGLKFQKRNGAEVGEAFHPSYAESAAPEEKVERRRNHAEQFIRGVLNGPTWRPVEPVELEKLLKAAEILGWKDPNP